MPYRRFGVHDRPFRWLAETIEVNVERIRRQSCLALIFRSPRSHAASDPEVSHAVA